MSEPTREELLDTLDELVEDLAYQGDVIREAMADARKVLTKYRQIVTRLAELGAADEGGDGDD